MLIYGLFYDEIPSMRTKLHRARLFLLSVLLIAVSALTGCGPRAIGYGVLLWSPDETSLATGSVVPVLEESRLKGTYSVKGTDHTLDLPTWRFRFFGDKKDAEAYGLEFEKVRDFYATANRKALPVREKADRLSERVYRLREDEKMKILEISTTPADENGMKGYWYKVLTEGGVSGYCFDYYLTVFNAKTDARISVSRNPGEENIAKILSSNWRPVYFREMIAERRVDFERFKTDYGLFLSSDPNQVKIALPTENLSFSYTKISEASGQTYLFEGSTARLLLRSGGREIVMYYTLKGEQKSTFFYAFDGEVEDVITRELERRKSILASLLEKGKTLRSSAFGEIEISEDGSFRWQGFERLVPNAIPPEAAGRGKIEFSRFLGREIKEPYDGVITFRHEGLPGGKSSSFLFLYAEGGLRLVHAPASTIQDNVVRAESRSPLILFFHFL
jgi:hypothetical protein